MRNNDAIFYDKAKQVWKEIAKKGSYKPLDFQIEVHQKLLNIFQPGDYYYFIFHVRNGEFEYVSPHIKKVLGYEPNIKAGHFLSRIHPEDQLHFIEFEKKLHYFFSQLSADKITKYKVQYDFRIRNNDDEYIRILHQLAIIEFDENKNLLRSLGIHTDVSHLLPETSKPRLSFIGLEDEPSFYNIDIDNQTLLPSQERFTLREKEVLKMIIDGFTTQEIANKLCRSKHTINSHRKNIFQKTESKTIADLVSNCIKNNWL